MSSPEEYSWARDCIGFQPDPELIFGDEEAIEHCSGVFFETLEPHFDYTQGQLNLKEASTEMEVARFNLLQDGYIQNDINAGFFDAVRSFKIAKDIKDYL